MIDCRAWCRVDLAGGTLDIWPLGQLFPGARTVNVAVDVAVHLRLERSESAYEIRQDGVDVAAASLGELGARAETALIAVFAQALDLPPFFLELASASPRGGGLGASSAIGAAFLAAAEVAFSLPRTTVAEKVHLARDLEARLMGLPTGTQDHYPALLGGALEIEHRAGGEVVRQLAVDLPALGDHLLVVDTGASHFSAGQNWRVVRGCLDGDEAIRGAFEEIAEVASAMPGALESGDFPAAGRLLHREWLARRRLSDGVSTPKLEQLLSRAASLGAWGGKVCGAGGGGCLAVLLPAELRDLIAEELSHLGGRPLPAHPVGHPLEITIEAERLENRLDLVG